MLPLFAIDQDREKYPACNCSFIWSQIKRAVLHKGETLETHTDAH